MKTWHCKKCGQDFDIKPIKHGNFIVQGYAPATDEVCNGEIVEIIDGVK